VPPLIDLAPGTEPPRPTVSAGMLDLLNAHGDVRTMDEIEAEVIRFAIAHYRGQMSEIARRLRIGRSTLYRKLDQYGLADRPAADRKVPAEAG